VSIYVCQIPIKVYGADDAERQARRYENDGDAEAAVLLRSFAQAIREQKAQPLRPNGEGNVYAFGAGR